MSGDGLTVTIVWLVTLPLLLVAVKVYVVVTVGLTDTEVPACVPKPLSILIVVAPLTDQERLAEPPKVTVEGEALNEEIVGELPDPPLEEYW